MSEHPVLISASFFALYSVANDFSPVDTSVDLFITTPELSANDLEPARVLLLFISSTTPLILSPSAPCAVTPFASMSAVTVSPVKSTSTFFVGLG